MTSFVERTEELIADLEQAEKDKAELRVTSFNILSGLHKINLLWGTIVSKLNFLLNLLTLVLPY